MSVKFEKLSKVFEELENTSSNNKMRDLITNLLKECNSDEIDDVVYLLLGQVSAKYEEINMNMGEKLVMKSVKLMSNTSLKRVEEEFNKLGDLGSVAEKLNNKKKSELMTEEVREELLKIANKRGKGSQEYKVKRLSKLLKKSNSLEARYIPRIVLGSLRLGVGDKTVLDALNKAFTKGESKKVLEKSYHLCSDISVIAQELVKNGLKGVKSIRIKTGRPIQSMLAQRVNEIEIIKEKIKSEKIACEEKYDGERVQAHYKEGSVELFSRRLTNITKQFPDVVKGLKKIGNDKSFIIDGEVVAITEEGKLEPFQKVMQRRRKYKVKQYTASIPVKYFVFDVLYYDGESYLNKDYDKRRKVVKELTKNGKRITPAVMKKCTSLECMQEFFNKSIKRGAEGIIVKDTSSDSTYEPGKRGWLWIKWKEEYQMSDTLDLVIVGAYYGKGKRGGTYGALLCAVYNEEKDRFETLCKLGTGFTDKELEELPERLKKYEVKNKPARVIIKKSMKPSVYFTPRVVVEVKGAEFTESPSHTAGKGSGKRISLRFPRFLKFRSDKNPEQATSIKEIKQLIKE